jgi:hypothetical protein
MAVVMDAETENFARRLARLRGETVEQAVSAAVRAELARMERSATEALTPSQQALVDETMAMVSALPKLPIDPADPTGFLYDATGLPH